MITFAKMRVSEPFERWSLPALLASHAASHPNGAFLQWTHERPALTYGQAYEEIGRLAFGLRRLGVAADDRVILYMHNSLAHVCCWFALNCLGAVDAPINPEYFGALLAHQISLVRPRYIICDLLSRP